MRPGIEVFLDDVPAALRGKQVGLITNNTGIDRSGRSDIDLIAQNDDLTLVACWRRNTVSAAPPRRVSRSLMVSTRRPACRSTPLCGAKGHSPTPEMLQDVDVLVYDLQEVGGRTWTYPCRPWRCRCRPR